MPQATPNLFVDGLRAAKAGDFVRAEEIAEALLNRDPNDVHGLQIIGFAAFCRGRNGKALEAFLHANRVAPGQPAILYWLGVLFKERGEFGKAESALKKAVAVNPAYGEAHCHLGDVLFFQDKQSEAREAFETALASEPKNSVVLAKAARFFEQTHDLARARDLAEQAIGLDPADEIAQIALAEIDLRENYPAQLVGRVAPLLKKEMSSKRNSARLSHLIATAYDRLNLCKEAFRAYVAANALQKELYGDAALSEKTPLETATLDRLIEFFLIEDISAWTKPATLEGPDPVFLLGFVRSGTTWLDQILSSHPSILVTVEEDNFADAWREFLLTPAGLTRLKSLDAAEVNRWRQAYWRRARRAMKEEPRGRLVIDKLPLNTVQLGLIYRLFPKAKIIFALRDPRDAVMSAFQQYFQVNAGMYHFLEIGSAAAFYDKVMRLGAAVRTKAPLALHTVRYESMVSDFEAQARAVIQFLGLEWDEAILDYDRTAKKRTIMTPSARQVIQRPYNSSIGKWRKYRNELIDILPVLDPWAKEFDYDPA